MGNWGYNPYKWSYNPTYNWVGAHLVGFGGWFFFSQLLTCATWSNRWNLGKQPTLDYAQEFSQEMEAEIPGVDVSQEQFWGRKTHEDVKQIRWRWRGVSMESELYAEV